jgi:hypothetical protein
MTTLVVYFTENFYDPHNVNVDVFNYHYYGEEVVIPPLTVVVCIPCRNHQTDHCHNGRDCILLTYDRGWSYVRPNDFVTVYILDNDDQEEVIKLEDGELLASFLIYNQEKMGVPIDKCLFGITPLLTERMMIDSDGDTNSNVSEEE